MINKIKSTSKQLLKETNALAMQGINKIVAMAERNMKKWQNVNSLTNAELRKVALNYTDYKGAKDVPRYVFVRAVMRVPSSSISKVVKAF